MAQEQISDKKPPYISYVTFKNFLEGLNNAVIPARIDKGLMSGMSGGTQTYLMATLKYLGLINEDFVPTSDLPLVAKGDKAAWDRVLKRSYAFIFNSEIDLKSGTEMQLLEQFESQGVTGDTRRKCLSFFAATCELANIELGPHIKGRTKSSSGVRRKSYKRRTDAGDGGAPNPPAPAAPPTVAGHTEALLPLTSDGSRIVKLTAPATVTSAELKRIQQWLGFQLIVDESE